MTEKDDVGMWTGRELLDADGEKIGTVDDVRYGEKTLGLTWLVVKSGLLGTKQILVPAAEVRREGEHLVVPFDKDFVKHAPEAEHNKYVLEEEERSVCSYYGLDYVSSLTRAEEGCIEGDDEDVDSGGDS
jgi:hypothetical protein